MKDNFMSAIYASEFVKKKGQNHRKTKKILNLCHCVI